MNGGAAFKERVGVEGDEGLVSEGDYERENEEVELEVFGEAVIGEGEGEGEGMVGFGQVIARGFEVVSSGADEMVESE